MNSKLSINRLSEMIEMICCFSLIYVDLLLLSLKMRCTLRQLKEYS